MTFKIKRISFFIFCSFLSIILCSCSNESFIEPEKYIDEKYPNSNIIESLSMESTQYYLISKEKNLILLQFEGNENKSRFVSEKVTERKCDYFLVYDTKQTILTLFYGDIENADQLNCDIYNGEHSVFTITEKNLISRDKHIFVYKLYQKQSNPVMEISLINSQGELIE